MPHHRIVPFLGSAPEKEAGQHRRHDNREQQRAQQRERHRPGHRFEQPPLHALQREDRDVSRDDDGDGVEYRPLHFVSRGANLIGHRQALAISGLLGVQVPHDVLDHHHRAIHHHAEIQRAQGQKIGWNMPQAEADGRKQQRKRNGYRHDQRRARVAEKQKQNDDHQDDALGQIVQHGVRGELHQFAAIDERNNLHARRAE